MIYREEGGIRVSFWFAVMDLLVWLGAWRSHGLRWRAYIWAVGRAAARDYRPTKEAT